jgi:hypothetical protein
MMTSPRFDIYGPIHKGLRAAHGDMLIRLGRTDFDAPDEILAALRGHLAFCRKHLAHEDVFMHPALEARLPGAKSEVERQHEEHLEDFERMDRAIAAVERAASADRPAAGRQLYLTFSTFVAADLAHMHWEETVLFLQMCALFSDAELVEMHVAIIASLEPQEKIASVRTMMPALNSVERAALLGGIKATAPPQAYEAIVQFAVRPSLGPGDLAALGLAA